MNKDYTNMNRDQTNMNKDQTNMNKDQTNMNTDQTNMNTDLTNMNKDQTNITNSISSRKKRQRQDRVDTETKITQTKWLLIQFGSSDGHINEKDIQNQ